MYTKESLNQLYRILTQELDISDEMFDLAEEEYSRMGKWIDDHTPGYKINIYPQGSFALGTVVRPITGKDDYDLDLVCSFEQSYGLTARAMKCDVVKPLLVGYRKTKGDLVEKRRCWHVEYDEVPNFHMDIVPAYNCGQYINITDHDEVLDTYEYLGSNPSGYADWFLSRCAYQRQRLYENYVREHKIIVAKAEIDSIKRRKIKTPLQRAVQILKRHRDVVCTNIPSRDKPISVIITTIAGQLYNEEDNIVDTLETILLSAERYIRDNIRGGEYWIPNPSFPSDNFANKWNLPETKHCAEIFINWIRKARADLTDATIYRMSRTDMGQHIGAAFGEATRYGVFKRMAEEDKAGIVSGSIKVNPALGTLSTTGTIPVPPHHHYGL